MDKREGQAIGAKAHGLPESQCPDRVHQDEDIEVRVMMAHGWYTGHDVCTCEVLMGGANINATMALDK